MLRRKHTAAVSVQRYCQFEAFGVKIKDLNLNAFRQFQGQTFNLVFLFLFDNTIVSKFQFNRTLMHAYWKEV